MNSEILQKLKEITPEERRILDGISEIDRELYMESPSNTVNSKKLLSRGKLITVRPHTRFVRFPEHTHDYIEVIYMCQGSTVHIINGEKLVLKTGELLFLPPSSRQEILPAGKDDIAVNFIILPEFFDQSMQMLGDESTPLKTFIIDCLKNKSSDTAYLHFEVADVLPVQNLVENLLYTLINGAPNKRNINQSTMGLLILQLINCTDRLSYNNAEDELTLRVLRYVEDNYRSASLSELAHNLHYDISWLSREIKRRTGKNFTDLVQNKRLSQAAYLLKNTTVNIDEIALQVGYENISYFHRIFRKKYGVSPKKFRDK
ncbi:MAG: AraC family transcriptional regulator [Eubacteriales bacterium]